MTETELTAMAADAIHGCMSTPNGVNTPAASGIPARYWCIKDTVINDVYHN